MQTSTHNAEHHHADRGGKVLAMVIGLLLLVAAIWALSTLFNRDNSAVTNTGTDMTVERNMTTTDDAAEPSTATP